MKDYNDVLSSLSLEEKARLLCGASNMGTYEIRDKGIRSLSVSDGPNGVRKERDKDNSDSLSSISGSLPCTAFPTGVVLANTWNAELAKSQGIAMAEECIHYGVNVILGPATNIKRNPKTGRNFEYYSEDPLISGKMAANYINGCQSLKVGVSLKHFACNNNEKYRFTGDSIVDERALREIYLKPFEIAIKESHPWCLMNAYNKINGVHCSENDYLMNKILRDEWGFDGLSMTDWGGIRDRVEGLKYGTDLEMPGSVEHNIQAIISANKGGSLPMEVIDKSVIRLLNTLERTEQDKKPCDFDSHYPLALQIAEEGAVLLKNDGTLPLSRDKKLLVIGDLFRMPRYQGSGSSLLNANKFVSHIDAWGGTDYEFVQGYDEFNSNVDSKLEEEALNKAKDYETILFFGGQNDYVESEGFDRDTIKLPENQLSLLDKLQKFCKKLVVVLFGGSSIELPNIDKVSSILYMGLAGETIGEATYNLLFGKANPSGKLTETWPLKYEDVPFGEDFTKTPNELYKESIYVGYRYYVSANKEVAYPFGFGLSYTTYEYSDFATEDKGDTILFRVNVKNTGKMAGKAVVQIYSGLKDSNIHRPLRELRCFTKVFLEPGEDKEVVLTLNKKDLSVYDIKTESFVVEDGLYNFDLCIFSSKVTSTTNVYVKGVKLEPNDNEIENKYYKDLSNLPNMSDDEYSFIIGRKIEPYIFSKTPYTWETPIGEYRSFVGWVFKKATMGVGMKKFKQASKIKDERIREREKKSGYFVYRLMPSNSLRSLCYSSNGSLPYNIALGMYYLINHHWIKGIKAMCQKEKQK